MKKIKLTTAIVTITFISLSVMSCNNGKKDNSKNTEVNQNNVHATNNIQKSNISVILKNYMALKDALVADNNKAAQKAAKMTMEAFKALNISEYNKKEQKELTDIIADAVENAEHISESPIKHQREHFKILSQDVTDLVTITGSKTKLYQDFCPMYDGGSVWLSLNKEIKNPYYGSKMLTCGKVQKEIN
ncbi:DUF3347 domain-containing protein [Tenacibaculum sp. UWU-22]|uniref:DUF3347 domain-containing protein n=1 Tax=Tenacibaculum sp. UWU-22 TaxID=3234187 RepID=UPI0034DACE91